MIEASTHFGEHLILALGGNAISPEGQEGNIDQQFAETRRSAARIVDVIESGYVVTLTHGNGPQIGNIIRRVELASHDIYKLSLDICVADSQGGMGYMIAQCLDNELQKRGIDRTFSTVITSVEVDPADPAFYTPSKPIGQTYPQEKAQVLMEQVGWQMMEIPGKGYRRVVASPLPKKIVEIDLIRSLIDQNHYVIACGGGGIPVVRGPDGAITGIEAVIDKDRTTALLAAHMNASVLVIVTGVNRVALDFGKPGERFLDRMNLLEACQYLQDGHFPAGSMGPKIQAAIDFLQDSPLDNPRVLICDIENMSKSLEGTGGTWIER
jgi:carbamate kinase